MLMVQVDATDILLVNQDGLYALQGICSHEYFELDKGFLTDGSITCALHLSRFDLVSGEALDPPAELPLVTFRVELVDDEIILEVPEGRDPRQHVTGRPSLVTGQPPSGVPSPRASAARRIASPKTTSARPTPRWDTSTCPSGRGVPSRRASPIIASGSG